ncbi:uncharacterized protein LOC126773080 [Nymphalis io]|uniref:uncharacterized protein LOC126773080 n=1 Tax=Inachis io TaxID=171585 RepID=UPI00216A9CC9|nr:uncharacterized protein LOC126773080 [Nymphalis io]
MGPRRSNNLIHISIVGCVVAWVAAQDYYEEHHRNQIRQIEHFRDIPTTFEVKGDEAVPIFNNYITNIQDLASKKNLVVTYKVKISTAKKNKQRSFKKDKLSYGKSKKYNIPLKKKNMKLSSFEIILRKRANDISFRHYNYNDETTTDKKILTYTTRQISAGKYKPVISAKKTKYAKIIHPVRNKIITLES